MTVNDKLQSSIPLECRTQQNPPAVEFNLETAIHSLDWASNDILVFGHDLGVGVLERTGSVVTMPTAIQRQWSFKKQYIHLGKRADLVHAKGPLVAAAHPDFSITVLDSNQRMTELGGTRGHGDYINSIDISHEGLVASTGDDRYLLVWEGDMPKSFRLAGTGLKVKFWDDTDSDRLVVLESGDKIRVLDWRKEQWLVTIYPGKPVHDVGVYGGDLVVVGEGWWKRFNLASLVGGCGYTPATEEGKLMVASYQGQEVFDNGRVAYASSSEVAIFDLRTENDVKFEYRNRQVNALALRHEGDVVAVASGKTLMLFGRQPEGDLDQVESL